MYNNMRAHLNECLKSPSYKLIQFPSKTFTNWRAKKLEAIMNPLFLSACTIILCIGAVAAHPRVPETMVCIIIIHTYISVNYSFLPTIGT